jgi:hypothetical protein
LVAYQFYADSLNTKLYSKIESFNFETGVSNWHHIDSCIGIGFRNIYADKDRIIVGGSSCDPSLQSGEYGNLPCLLQFNQAGKFLEKNILDYRLFRDGGEIHEIERDISGNYFALGSVNRADRFFETRNYPISIIKFDQNMKKIDFDTMSYNRKYSYFPNDLVFSSDGDLILIGTAREYEGISSQTLPFVIKTDLNGVVSTKELSKKQTQEHQCSLINTIVSDQTLYLEKCQDTKSFEIIDIQGRKVLNGDLKSQSISLHSLNKGLYFLALIDDHRNKKIYKFVF